MEEVARKYPFAPQSKVYEVWRLYQYSQQGKSFLSFWESITKN